VEAETRQGRISPRTTGIGPPRSRRQAISSIPIAAAQIDEAFIGQVVDNLCVLFASPAAEMETPC
jgi:hypothetical protein